MIVIEHGRIARGEMTGERWEISRQEVGERYRLEIAGEFFASADSVRELLDEVENLDGFFRG